MGGENAAICDRSVDGDGGGGGGVEVGSEYLFLSTPPLQRNYERFCDDENSVHMFSHIVFILVFIFVYLARKFHLV